MALEVTGKLIKILNPQTGSGRNGNWQKQEFVIETFDQYPKKICISAWGEKVDELNRMTLGDNLKVSVNLESREYNEKWYTDCRAWRIEKDGGEARSGNGGNTSSGQGNKTAPAYNSNDDFGFEPYQPTSNASAPIVDDDLPF